MKRFKFIIVGLLLTILSFSQSTELSSDSMELWYQHVREDTVHVNVEVKAKISSEPIRKNEGLQKVLEQEVEGMTVIDQNLKDINSTLSKSAEVNMKSIEEVIYNQGLNLRSMAKRKSTAIKVSNILTILFILGFFAVNVYEKYAYSGKRKFWLPGAILLSGIFIFKFLLPELLMGSYTADYEFWDLFKYIF